MIFPEGTNLTAETLKKSDAFALSHQVKPYTHVLHPRVTGFVHVFNQMYKNEMIDSIDDVTIGYVGDTKIPDTEIEFLSGCVPDEIHFFIRRYSIDQMINESDDEALRNKSLENWLNKVWDAKNSFLKW